MGKGKLSKLFVLVGLLMAASGGVLFYMDKDHYFSDDKTITEPNNIDNVESNVESASVSDPVVKKPVVISDYNGVYSKENATIKMHSLNGYADVSIVGENINIHEKANVSETPFSIGGFCNIDVSEGSLNVSCDDANITGVYEKVDKYDSTDFYTDNIGDPTYVDSKYFGEYEFNGIHIIMYQVDESEVYIRIKSTNEEGTMDYSFTLNIVEDGSLHLDETGSIIDIVFNEDDTIGVTFDTENVDYITFDGTYTKVRTLTIENIVELILAE